VTQTQYLLLGALGVALVSAAAFFAYRAWSVRSREVQKERITYRTEVACDLLEDNPKVKYVLDVVVNFHRNRALPQEVYEGQTFLVEYDVIVEYDSLARELQAGTLDLDMFLDRQASVIALLFVTTKDTAQRVRTQSVHQHFGLRFEWLSAEADKYREAWFQEPTQPKFKSDAQ